MYYNGILQPCHPKRVPIVPLTTFPASNRQKLCLADRIPTCGLAQRRNT